MTSPGGKLASRLASTCVWWGDDASPLRVIEWRQGGQDMAGVLMEG